MKEGKKLVSLVELIVTFDRPDITVDVNQTDGSAEYILILTEVQKDMLK